MAKTSPYDHDCVIKIKIRANLMSLKVFLQNQLFLFLRSSRFPKQNNYLLVALSWYVMSSPTQKISEKFSTSSSSVYFFTLRRTQASLNQTFWNSAHAAFCMKYFYEVGKVRHNHFLGTCNYFNFLYHFSHFSMFCWSNQSNKCIRKILSAKNVICWMRTPMKQGIIKLTLGIPLSIIFNLQPFKAKEEIGLPRCSSSWHDNRLQRFNCSLPWFGEFWLAVFQPITTDFRMWSGF